MKTFRITYTCDHVQEMNDDFRIIVIEAHNQTDADLIIHNIERYFDGVTVALEEEDDKPKRTRRVNSDRRKKPT